MPELLRAACTPASQGRRWLQRWWSCCCPPARRWPPIRSVAAHHRSLHASTVAHLLARASAMRWGAAAACWSLTGAGAAASCREDDGTREREKKEEATGWSCCILALYDVQGSWAVGSVVT
jgi:hypothetical protein